MADDNKPLKYARYAIGEIVLVVIGILIALQINNWNEQRKLKAREIQFLRQMRSNLLEDMSDDYPIRIYEKSIEASQIVISSLENCDSSIDSLNYYFGWIPAYTFYMTNTTAYENLKATGFDIISSDSLRERYQTLYRFNYKFLDLQSNSIAIKRADELKEYFMEYFSDFQSLKNATPLDFENLCKNHKFIELIKFNRNEKLKRLEWIQNTRKEIQSIVDMIDAEIKANS